MKYVESFPYKVWIGAEVGWNSFFVSSSYHLCILICTRSCVKMVVFRWFLTSVAFSVQVCGALTAPKAKNRSAISTSSRHSETLLKRSETYVYKDLKRESRQQLAVTFFSLVVLTSRRRFENWSEIKNSKKIREWALSTCHWSNFTILEIVP